MVTIFDYLSLSTTDADYPTFEGFSLRLASGHALLAMRVIAASGKLKTNAMIRLTSKNGSGLSREIARLRHTASQ
jgi:hypothetical protein